MSFSADVKNELARLPAENPCCSIAECSAVLRMSGALAFRGQKMGINFSTENAALARKMLQTLKGQFKVQTEVVVTRSRRFKKNNRYQVRVLPSEEVEKIVFAMRLSPMDFRKLEDDLLKNICCRKAFLRGAFMASGSVSKPQSDYHLELTCESENFAKNIIKTMKYFNLTAKLTDRKEEQVIYLKEGDAVSAFLSVAGASNAYMEFENVRVLKDMRNNVNRIVNCETANLEKTIKSAVWQIAYIKFLQKKNVFLKMKKTLRDVAELRLNNPESSLLEMASLADPPLTKSGINHRLKKIEQIALENGWEQN